MIHVRIIGYYFVGHLGHIALSALQTSYTCDSLSFDVDLVSIGILTSAPL